MEFADYLTRFRRAAKIDTLDFMFERAESRCSTPKEYMDCNAARMIRVYELDGKLNPNAHDVSKLSDLANALNKAESYGKTGNVDTKKLEDLFAEYL